MDAELPLNDDRRQPREGSEEWAKAELNRFLDLTKKHGSLLTPFWAKLVVGVSKQRIHQLLNEGHLPHYTIMGTTVIPADSLLEFASVKRTTATRYTAAGQLRTA